MTARVDLDVIPESGRPAEVGRALDEARTLRDRHREANEALARAEVALEQREAADVEAAAGRIRAGEAPGNLSAGINKARHTVEIGQRNAAALDLAARAAADDLAAVIREQADGWRSSLDAEAEQARQRALAALDAFDEATRAFHDATAAGAWVSSGLNDGRFDRRPGAIINAARSSARMTANNAPLTTDVLVAYLREAIEPPPTPTPPLQVETSQT